VSRFISGSISELFGETRLLLPTVLNEAGGSLADPDREMLRGMIDLLEQDFRTYGA
jgi:hypothetical protein